jgi:putative flippase GtrA
MTEAWRIMRFLAVGGLNTVFSYGCLVGLHALGMPLGVAVGLSTLMGVLFNFYSFGALVFRPARGAAAIRFVLLYAGIAVLNYMLLRLLAAFSVPVALGQVLCLPILAAASYTGMRFWVYGLHPTPYEQDVLQ